MVNKIAYIYLIIVSVLLILFASHAVRAEDDISIGFGAFRSAESSPTETKILRIAHREDMDAITYWQLEGGLWVDNAGGGRESSAFIAGSTGLKLDFSPVFVMNSLGLAAITTPDAYLGGVFPQFTEEFGVGINAKNQTALSLSYKHFSSAGIFSPNMGRDFFILTMGIGL